MFSDLINSTFSNSFLIRNIFAFGFSLIFSIIGLKYLIVYFKNRQKYQPIREEGLKSHLLSKQKVPTMGGLISCVAILLSGLFFCDTSNIYIVATLFISMSFGFLGLIDDIIKVFFRNTIGLKGSIKLALQIAICGFTLLWMSYKGSPILNSSNILVPYIHYTLYIGFLLIPFLIAVIVGSGNAVNLTDGLDGLVIIPVIFCTIALGIISYFGSQGNIITLIDTNTSELTILCSSVVGASIGFLIYNKYPAKIFMGDSGSLMYGSLLGTIAVILGQEIFFGIAGLLFVIEAISVIIQVTAHFFWGKRIFKMAPFHHHLEKSGWSERKVILNFWLFSLICVVIAFLGIIKF